MIETITARLRGGPHDGKVIPVNDPPAANVLLPQVIGGPSSKAEWRGEQERVPFVEPYEALEFAHDEYRLRCVVDGVAYYDHREGG